MRHLPTLADQLGGTDILNDLGVYDPFAPPADGFDFSRDVVDAARDLPNLDGGGDLNGPPNGGSDLNGSPDPDGPAIVAFADAPTAIFAPGQAFDPADGSADAKPSGTPGGGGGGSGGGGNGGGGSGGGSTDPGVLSEYMAGSADGEDGYDIYLDFKGTWTHDLQQAFIAAADYFTNVITNDVGVGAKYHGKDVDDLYVSAELSSIDGTGGVLGQAGPSATWSANDLTAAGVMQFDSADAENFYGQGLWDDIVTHEMMHVLGFGSLWNYGSHVGLVDGEQYTGQHALAAYRASTDQNADFIPVELDGGSGTAGSHWDEQALGDELMTGYINNPNHLSEFSVQALADLGYDIDYSPFGV